MRILTFLVLALLAAPVVAQGKQDEAKAEYDKLVAEYDAAVAVYRKEMGALTATEEYKKLREARDREGLMKLRSKVKQPDTPAFVKRFKAGADKYADKDAAVPFLVWVATRARSRDLRKEAAGTLVTKHVTSSKLTDFVDGLPRMGRALGQEKVDAMLGTIIEKSPHDLVKAHAWMARANGIRGRNLTAEQEEQKHAYLEKVIKLAPGTVLAMRAAAPMFEKERLQVGMKVPDIEGKDPDGVAFKLSDYRGKVVLIDFWGHW